MDKILNTVEPGTLKDIINVLFSNSHEGVIITNEQDIVLSVNPAFCLITGFNYDEIVGTKTTFFKSNRYDKRFYNNLWNKLNKLGRWSGTLWDRRKNGEIFLMDLTITEVKNLNSQERIFIGIFTDLTNSEHTASKKINHDPLTNLPNRMLLRDHLGFILAHARRNNLFVALLLLDIDRFKIMNDSLGYYAGDMVLVNTSERMKKTLREADTIFRLGNDEFAIVLQGISKIEDAAKVAKKILQVFNTPFSIPNFKNDLYVSASVGISIFPQDGSTYEALIKNAETAMYKAKELEQNNFQHYNPAMNASTFEHLTMEHNLHKALEQNEFIVFYQPIVDICSNVIVGAEALVRWRHPELGVISPAQFIPIAEETGLITAIDEYVMKAACQQTKEWHVKGYDDFHISVNISARQFQQQDLVQKIEKVLIKADIVPYALELEITESIGMKNAEKSFIILNQLKEKGINISIDDFGTGYSSLSYLKKFPIDILKIDQSFIKDISTDHDDESLVSLIISMAHTLKLRVIAEGVETEEQLAFLKQNNCDLFQGYLFSRPVPADEFEKLLSENWNSYLQK